LADFPVIQAAPPNMAERSLSNHLFQGSSEAHLKKKFGEEYWEWRGNEPQLHDDEVMSPL
jgi:hypothetical protein